MRTVFGNGINDMPRGWTVENKYNKIIYDRWRHMLERCYSKKLHERYPTYIGCSVCTKWLKLSGFVEEFKLINGYNEELFLLGKLCLDKDIKSNGKNKIYCLEQCMWVSKSENTRQSNKTMDYSFMQERTGENHHLYGKNGENHPMYGRTGKENSNSIKIAQYDKQTYELIKIWDCSMDIQRELGTNSSHIIACCKFWEINCDKEKWFKTHKNNPYKTTGGFIWKYAEKEDN